MLNFAITGFMGFTFCNTLENSLILILSIKIILLRLEEFTIFLQLTLLLYNSALKFALLSIITQFQVQYLLLMDLLI